MIDLRPVFFVIGILLTILSATMILPMLADIAARHEDWSVFAASAAVTLFVGVALVFTNRADWATFNIRQAFAVTTFSWIAIALFGAVPLYFSELGLSFTDAFFESMSGVTTTGSTVIVGLDHAPPGLLLWRSMMQWLGGIGIIVVAIGILPLLSVGGMQMFRVEAFETEKVLPRAAQIASGIGLIYLGLTVALAFAYGYFGMGGFDAVNHAMTTIATGGYSTRDASFGFWDDRPAIHWLGSLGMVLGAIPFVLYLRALRGSLQALLSDSQVQWMFALLFGWIGLLFAYLVINSVLPLEPALRHAAFNVISIMTGTGYASADFGLWGGFVMVQMLILMVIGGCAGSTSCGIKVFRFQVVYAEAKVQARRLMFPNGVFIPYYNNRPIPEHVAQAVMGFIFVYVLSIALLALALGLFGLDFITAVSGATTAISNVGPGLGDVVGPAGNFASLPDAAKWLLSFGMLLGRLELFTVLILMSPGFWRG